MVKAKRKNGTGPETGRPLRAYACSLVGSDHETTIHARSRGDAKARFWRRLDGDFGYVKIRCRCIGDPVTTDGIRRTAEYRGVPFACAGMRVLVDGVPGVIVGHNSSANFDVLFDDETKWAGQVLNCHPTWEIVYFDDEGKAIRDFRQLSREALVATS